MATQTTSYLQVIEQLPSGRTATFYDVPWEEYETLLSVLGDDYHVRINYIRGRLEFMSPSQYHEMYAFLLEHLALITAETIGLDFESRGSTTFKKKTFKSGAEPDSCFYVNNAPKIIGVRILNLSRDPAPEVIVEIDVSHSSLFKFDFYARLGVSEIWRYDEKRLRIYQLIGRKYVDASASRVFPVLTGEALTKFLEQSKTEGQTAVRRAFRQWLEENLSEKI
jgi:Uma2 family endonuclease